MIFWEIEHLKRKIEGGELKEKDRFGYAFIYLVLCGIGMEVMKLLPLENGNLWDAFDSVSSVLIGAIGTALAFRANGGAEGNDFLGKYFSIGLVISIRFIVLLIPMSAVLLVFYIYAFPGDDEISSTFFDTVPFVLWYMALYWRICKHMKDVQSS